ncbi:MAG: T9SS type A sorting domain-containing protein [Firmicutes bacterium]|nr:T9SS type A sorting domain-containing protein [Bacillota bacterium]
MKLFTSSIQNNISLPRITALICILLCSAQWANTQPVSLDTTFGENGITTIPLQTSIRFFDFDNSGNIIALVRGLSPSIIKTDANGMLDNNFGDNGIVKLNMQSPLGLKITKTKKILVIGQIGYNHCLMQFHEDGTLDNTFGTNGIVTISNQILTLPIVNFEHDDFFLLIDGYNSTRISKYDYEGRIVQTFGDNGTVILDLRFLSTTCSKIIGEHSLFLAGCIRGVEHELALLKIKLDNGDLDLGFANNGIWTMNIFDDYYTQFHGEFEIFTDIIEDSNGNIIASGVIQGGKFSFITNFLPDGTLNLDFGDGGFFYFDYSFDEYLSTQKILKNDNKFIAGLYTTNIIHFTDRVISVKHNGILDTDFNNSGVSACENFSCETMKLQTPNKLIIGGMYSPDGNSTYVSLARLNIPSDVSVSSYPNIENSIKIFPNPSSEQLFFSKSTSFEITDLHGKVLLKSNDTTLSVNINHLSPGIYFIKFDNNQVNKFIKK